MADEALGGVGPRKRGERRAAVLRAREGLDVIASPEEHALALLLVEIEVLVEFGVAAVVGGDVDVEVSAVDAAYADRYVDVCVCVLAAGDVVVDSRVLRALHDMVGGEPLLLLLGRLEHEAAREQENGDGKEGHNARHREHGDALDLALHQGDVVLVHDRLLVLVTFRAALAAFDVRAGLLAARPGHTEVLLRYDDGWRRERHDKDVVDDDARRREVAKGGDGH
mmetsp:Transcript_38529/g.120601  ORF Transcript_38529/g.120601 Transcript_38529/m.120601 type:complete len:224 (-) Transcript_38529:1821-2492(-)